MLKRVWRRALGALGLLAVTGCATAPQQAEAVRPAMWRVADADTTVYLFGTIHLLPENYRWRTSRFDQAVAGSQSLIVETIFRSTEACVAAACSGPVPPPSL